MISNNHSQESPIKGSVRARILNLLYDEQEHRFSEITKSIDKADNVIDRELKILIKKGWVIKKARGLYVVNKKVKSLTKYMQTLDAMPNPDDIYYPINLNMDYFKEAFEELKNNQQSNTPLLDKALPHISITVAGKKLEHFKPSILEGQSNEICAIFDFMIKISFIRLMAEAQEINPKKQIRKEESATDAEILESLEDILYNQDFKLIVSWSPNKK